MTIEVHTAGFAGVLPAHLAVPATRAGLAWAAVTSVTRRGFSNWRPSRIVIRQVLQQLAEVNAYLAFHPGEITIRTGLLELDDRQDARIAETLGNVQTKYLAWKLLGASHVVPVTDVPDWMFSSSYGLPRRGRRCDFVAIADGGRLGLLIESKGSLGGAPRIPSVARHQLAEMPSLPDVAHELRYVDASYFDPHWSALLLQTHGGGIDRLRTAQVVEAYARRWESLAERSNPREGIFLPSVGVRIHFDIDRLRSLSYEEQSNEDGNYFRGPDGIDIAVSDEWLSVQYDDGPRLR